MSNDNIEQLSPQGDTRENEFGGLLAAASDFARGVLESIQALAGTTACKGVQIARLKDWAQVRNNVTNGVTFRDAIIFIKKLKIITNVFRRLLEESENSCKFAPTSLPRFP